MEFNISVILTIIPAICSAVRFDFLRILLPINRTIKEVIGIINKAIVANFILIIKRIDINVIIFIGSIKTLWKLVPSAILILETSLTRIDVNSPLLFLSKNEIDKL